MNKLTMALIVSSTGAIFFCPQVNAQKHSHNPRNLPNGSNFYKHRHQLQIIDTGPDIIDRRRRKKPTKQYVINIQPLRDPGTQTIFVNSPNGARSPNAVVIDGDTPPPAGFESNMHALKPRSGLPPTNMGMLRKHAAQKKIHGRLGPVKKARTGNQLMIKPQEPTKTLKYPALNSSSTSDRSRTSTDVKGEVKTDFKKGSLLK